MLLFYIPICVVLSICNYFDLDFKKHSLFPDRSTNLEFRCC